MKTALLNIASYYPRKSLLYSLSPPWSLTKTKDTQRPIHLAQAVNNSLDLISPGKNYYLLILLVIWISDMKQFAVAA